MNSTKRLSDEQIREHIEMLKASERMLVDRTGPTPRIVYSPEAEEWFEQNACMTYTSMAAILGFSRTGFTSMRNANPWIDQAILRGRDAEMRFYRRCLTEDVARVVQLCQERELPLPPSYQKELRDLMRDMGGAGYDDVAAREEAKLANADGFSMAPERDGDGTLTGIKISFVQPEHEAHE